MNVTDNRSAASDSEPSGALVSALTTEHYTLQAARSSTVAEANGRGMIFLSTVSGAMVALALVAQVDRLGQTFLLFALSILPALLVLGLTSYARLADLAVHDAYYARGIGRIRAFYFTLDPSAHQSHIAAAVSLGIDGEEIDRARQGTSGDPAIAPMVAYGLQVYKEPTAITTAQVEELRSLGYSDREIADVVGVVALNVLTGAFNLAAGLRPDLT